MQERQIETLRWAIDALVREFKIADSSRAQDGSPALNPSDVQTLIYVGKHEGCIARDVAEFLGVPPTSMSTIIDRLVRRGCLSRERTDKNRRVVVLSLTDAGRNVLEKVLEKQRRHCAAMLEILEEKDREKFVAQFSEIAKGVTRVRQNRNDTNASD